MIKKIQFYYLTGLILFALVCPFLAWGMHPVENLVLGNFSDKYSEDKSDPLEYIFNRNFSDPKIADYKNDLALYRGFYEEGKNLTNSCKINSTIRYASEWDKQQVIRSIMAEIQYIGLDLTARAIPQYAKYFEFRPDEYQNLVDDLVGNSCSTNLSVISKKELRNNLLLKFEKENKFHLPSVKNNPLFPDNLETYVPERQRMEQEFKMTIKLFRSVCSWSGDPYSPGLMVPLIKHPALMAFINRQMNFRGISWTPAKNTLNIVDSNKTVQVVCENLICRKTNYANFKSKIPMALGGTNFYEDFKALYCDHFQMSDYVSKGIDPRLAAEIKSKTFDEENLMVGQFIALITGYPEFLLGLDKFKEGEDLIRSSMDYTWRMWALGQTNNYTRELFFEEPLTIELVDRRLVFDKNNGILKVGLDVNLGEFDRINQANGKIKMLFNVSIGAKFLNYTKRTLNELDYTKEIEAANLQKMFKLQIAKDVEILNEKLILAPWKNELSELITNELMEQIRLTDDQFFPENDSGMKNIIIEINYSPFALKYLNHQFKVLEKENPAKL